jgi:hypothetical protein
MGKDAKTKEERKAHGSRPRELLRRPIRPSKPVPYGKFAWLSSGHEQQ